MKRLLLITNYYLPGFKNGGPIRSLANLVDWLGDEFEFRVLTADRDRGDDKPYSCASAGRWQKVGKAQVLYLRPTEMSFFTWRLLLNEIHYDLLYLSSFFAPETRRVLLLRRIGLVPDKPVIVSPRGEFSPGALNLKTFKKRLYIQVGVKTGAYNRITWHATGPTEKQDILKAFARHRINLSPRITIAGNLVPRSSLSTRVRPDLTKHTNSLRSVFLSRISRMKNLDFALNIMRGLRGEIAFDIYGPLEDWAYWWECRQIVAKLEPSIRVNYKGELHHDGVLEILSEYHLLFLPTRGENFGHVIFESLLAGCPVLISDRTPWRELESKGIGWDLSLTEPSRFRSVLQYCLEMGSEEFAKWSTRASHYAKDFVLTQAASELQSYRRLFKNM